MAKRNPILVGEGPLKDQSYEGGSKCYENYDFSVALFLYQIYSK